MSLETDIEIGVGFIGAGDISLYHAAGITDKAKLIGLYDPKLGESRAQEFNCHQYRSAQALVNDPNIDAVFVLTPMEAHYPNVKRALEAGKHVLVEKPVGVTINEIQEMERLAEENDLVCMPGHNYIYDPGVERIKELISQGDLGILSSIYVLYNIHHPEAVAMKYPGVIRQVMTHHAYTLLYLAGEPENIQAVKATQHYDEFKEEDIAMANLKMINGALAHLEVSFVTDDHSSDPWSFIIKVLGTEGSARFSYNDWVLNKRGIVHSHTYAAYPQTIKNEDEHFLACIRGEKKPLSTLDDAITAQIIIEGIEQSIAEERTVYF